LILHIGLPFYSSAATTSKLPYLSYVPQFVSTSHFRNGGETKKTGPPKEFIHLCGISVSWISRYHLGISEPAFSSFVVCCFVSDLKNFLSFSLLFFSTRNRGWGVY
jgi:hypothetical protein